MARQTKSRAPQAHDSSCKGEGSLSQLTDQHTPEHLEGAPPTTGHRALSAGLGHPAGPAGQRPLAYTAYLLFALLFSGNFVPYFFIGNISAVLAAGLVATRWRSTPAAGAALVLLTSTIFAPVPALMRK
jgi:hypothetical protein